MRARGGLGAQRERRSAPRVGEAGGPSGAREVREVRRRPLARVCAAGRDGAGRVEEGADVPVRVVESEARGGSCAEPGRGGGRGPAAPGPLRPSRLSSAAPPRAARPALPARGKRSEGGTGASSGSVVLPARRSAPIQPPVREFIQEPAAFRARCVGRAVGGVLTGNVQRSFRVVFFFSFVPPAFVSGTCAFLRTAMIVSKGVLNGF